MRHSYQASEMRRLWPCTLFFWPRVGENTEDDLPACARASGVTVDDVFQAWAHNVDAVQSDQAQAFFLSYIQYCTCPRRR